MVGSERVAVGELRVLRGTWDRTDFQRRDELGGRRKEEGECNGA